VVWSKRGIRHKPETLGEDLWTLLQWIATVTMYNFKRMARVTVLTASLDQTELHARSLANWNLLLKSLIDRPRK
jgi:hypothetical protein